MTQPPTCSNPVQEVLFDAAHFYADFHKKVIVAARIKQLEDLKLDEIQSSRGWFGWELPDCSWTKHWHATRDVANYRAWPAEAPGWIIQVKNGDSNTCMLRNRAVSDMSDSDWKELLQSIENLKSNGYLDDSYMCDVESDYQDEAWKERYRKEFQQAMLNKFDGVFATMQHGESLQRKFEEVMADDKLTDNFFCGHVSSSFGGGEWTEESDGDQCLNVEEVVRGIDTSDVKDHIWPEDPRQLKFKFTESAKLLAIALLNDDLVTMIDAPLATEIVDILLETDGPHNHSCVLIDLPKELSDQIMEWSLANVDDNDIFVDKKIGKGREAQPHVTVLYGLTDDEPSDKLLQVFEHTAPFEIKLGPCSLFKQDDYDVLKMEVISPFLHSLNQNVRAVVPYENDYPSYTPHVTIAYCKPGTCDRLEGVSPWDDPVKMGVTSLRQYGVFTANTVIFSSLNDHKNDYELGKAYVTAKEVKEAWKEDRSWQHNLFDMDMGFPPRNIDEFTEWLSRLGKEYERKTGKNFDILIGASRADFQNWLENRMLLKGVGVSEATDEELDELIIGSGSADIPHQVSHRTIRRIVGRHIVDEVEIWRNTGKNLAPLARHAEGNIRITYRENGRFDSPRRVWTSEWASYAVLKWSLRNWRNLYGVPLVKDGHPAGVVSFKNPELGGHEYRERPVDIPAE